MTPNKHLFFLLTVFFIFYCEPGYSAPFCEKGTHGQDPPEDLSLCSSPSFDLENLHLDLSVSFDKKELEGFAEWTFTNKQGSKSIVFDVEKILVEKVETEGKALQWKIKEHPGWHSQGLEIFIPEKCRKVSIYYKTSPEAAALQWLSKDQTLSAQPFLYTQSQAVLARSWVPCFDRPEVRFTYSASVRVPGNLLALMSAENPQQLNENGLYHFKMSQKIPSYLLALAVGDLRFRALDGRSGIYAEPPLLENTAEEFSSLPHMIEVAESLYGPYQWGRYDLLFLPASFPFGGMENPRLTFATPTIIAGDGSLVALVAHELAHSWTGNLVTNSRWTDFWLNEGFTVYFENRIMEALYGKEYAEMLAVLGWGDLKSTLEEMGSGNELTRLEQRNARQDPDLSMTDIAYEKGRFFLCHIEKVIGRPAFDAFLKKYFRDYAFGNLNTEEFRTYFYTEVIAGDSALAKAIGFDAWTRETDLPAGFQPPFSAAFQQIDSLSGFILTKDSAALAATKNWTTHHWLYFLREAEINAPQMALLDSLFHLTASGNAEIVFVWLMLAVRNDYKPAFIKLEEFLSLVGRRKFVRPLYAAMADKPELKSFGLDVYKKNRHRYHSVTVNSVDQIFGYKP